MKDNEISLELAARVAQFAKQTGRTFREAFRYLLRRGAQQEPPAVFIGYSYVADANVWINLKARLATKGWTLRWRD